MSCFATQNHQSMNLHRNDGHVAILTHRFFRRVIFLKVTEKHHLSVKTYGHVCYYCFRLKILRKNSIYHNFLQDYSDGGKMKSDLKDQITENTQCSLTQLKISNNMDLQLTFYQFQNAFYQYWRRWVFRGLWARGVGNLFQIQIILDHYHKII